MTSIAIYVEGGGDSAAGKAALRQGFDALLAPQKEAARLKRIGWKLVMCGTRRMAFDAFQHATDQSGEKDVVALLVDAEAPVTRSNPKPKASDRIAHLTARDQWDLSPFDAERVHLMTQCMETWIVADPGPLAEFYGKGFHAGALPKRQLLDDEPKTAIYAALEAATKSTQKGSYGKIKHASELLKRLRPAVVAGRCQSFKDFTTWLDNTIKGA